MKIKSLEVDNHPVLGTFTYSFEEDKAITLLVSENGSGKTKLMEFAYTLLDKGFRLWEIPEWKSGSISRVKLFLQLSPDECDLLPRVTINEGSGPVETAINGNIYLEATEKRNDFGIISIYSFNERTAQYEQLASRNFPGSLLGPNNTFSNLLRERVRFSTVEINYTEPKVERPGAFNIDEETPTKSPKNLAEITADLLVSLSLEDDRVFRKQNSTPGSVVSDFTGKFDRFKKAYNTLFAEGIELIGVEIENKEYVVKFKNLRTSKEFPLKGLSSGQQQVVYRVGYLLQNINISDGGVVFIDEPELSLHPRWQERYLNFLLELFGENLQFIIATHSPYIVKTGINNTSVGISKLELTPTGLIDEKLTNGSKLSQPTLAEVSHRAFGITSEEFHIELYLELQKRFAPESWDTTQTKYTGGTPTNLDSVLRAAPYNIAIYKTWTDTNSKKSIQETIMTFVRNGIHHGSDSVSRGRPMYTKQELEQSVSSMLSLL